MSFLILQGIFALLWPFFIINTPEYCMNLTEEDRIAFSGRHSQQPQPAAMQPVYYLSSAPDHAQASVALNCGAKDWNAYLCCEMISPRPPPFFVLRFAFIIIYGSAALLSVLCIILNTNQRTKKWRGHWERGYWDAIMASLILFQFTCKGYLVKPFDKNRLKQTQKWDWLKTQNYVEMNSY